MKDYYYLVLSAFYGIAIGIFFFGSLWWTVQKGLTAVRPVLLFFVSFIIRTSVALIGFYLVSCGQWQNLLTCLLGFVIARAVVNRFTRPKIHSQIIGKKN